jgi:hypothetical protein
LRPGSPGLPDPANQRPQRLAANPFERLAGQLGVQLAGPIQVERHVLTHRNAHKVEEEEHSHALHTLSGKISILGGKSKVTRSISQITSIPFSILTAPVWEPGEEENRRAYRSEAVCDGLEDSVRILCVLVQPPEHWERHYEINPAQGCQESCAKHGCASKFMQKTCPWVRTLTRKTQIP